MKDERIKAMERALSPERAPKLLRQTCEGSGWKISRVLGIDLVEYRPGRRVTIRYTVEAAHGQQPRQARTLFGKAYRGHGGARVYELLQKLPPYLPDGLRIPAPLGYNERHRFLLMDAVEGVPLADLLALPDGRRLLADLGHRLARLHASGSQGTPPQPEGPAIHPAVQNWAPACVHSARDEIGILNRALIRVGGASRLPEALRQRHTELHTRICEALITTVAADRPVPSIVHRDLYPDQVLVHENGFGLVDLDEVAQGEAEIDVGNFIAHLLLRDLQIMGTIGPALEHARAFCSGYSRARELFETRLRAYATGALLRLASLERISLSGISILPWRELSAALAAQALRLLDQPWPFRCTATSVDKPYRAPRDA